MERNRSMNEIQEKFLEALRVSLKNGTVQWEEPLQPGQWKELFGLAETHHVLPLIYEAIYRSLAAGKADPQLMTDYKWKAVQLISLQALKTESFLCLMESLNRQGVYPVTVKGIICRNLYPKPDCRISGDEDILIPKEQFGKCHQVLTESGLKVADESQDIEKEYEVSYTAKKGTLYIELHKSLFPPESNVYGDFNRFFDHADERCVEIETEGRKVRTLGYTDHFFYLICHAFKHFLHSGFGIRQVCDIILYASHYGSEIDWDQVLKQCSEIRGEYFTAALFQIGEKYLDFHADSAGVPKEWQAMKVDETMMLEDLLSAGIYGYGSKSRMHSSNITLNTAADQWHGRHSSNIFKALFPSAGEMEKKYPYLRKHKWLLPAAWITRIGRYCRETAGTSDQTATEALQIGKHRVELMKTYRIIK